MLGLDPTYEITSCGQAEKANPPDPLREDRGHPARRLRVRRHTAYHVIADHEQTIIEIVWGERESRRCTQASPAFNPACVAVLFGDPQPYWRLSPSTISEDERQMLRLARRLIVREDGVSVVEGALLLALIGSALAAVVPSIPIGTGFTGISAVIARNPSERPGAEVNTAQATETVRGRSQVTELKPVEADRRRPATMGSGRHRVAGGS